MPNHKTRLIIGGVLSVLLIVALHVVGAGIAIFGWFVYGCWRLAVHLNRSGNERIAKANADALVKAQAAERERAGQDDS